MDYGYQILVTGGTGFIGRHVVDALLSGGHKLILTIRLGAKVPLGWAMNDNLQIVPTDFMNINPSLFEGDVHRIVHLAGYSGGPVRDHDQRKQLTQLNALLTQHMIELARALNVKSFVNVSSIRVVVGNSSPHVIDDMSTPAPLDPYGESKRKSEEYVAAFAAEGGQLAVSLRPPLVVGGDAKGNWRSLMKLSATGWPLPFASIRNERSFISVQSLVDAIVLLCGRDWPAEASGAYALADPAPVSLPDVITELRAGMDLPPRLFTCPPAAFDLAGSLTGRSRQIAGLTGSLRVDASRFFSTFSFQPALPLREAIRLSGRDYLAASRQRHPAPPGRD